jgi:hypothetical protein
MPQYERREYSSANEEEVRSATPPLSQSRNPELKDFFGGKKTSWPEKVVCALLLQRPLGLTL